ncbi:MAG: DUF192 domain-containing protein [Neomegalonema sp.]|nr:DUF192 domain-containing protein [Neomegalonema sp.]
MQVRFIWVGAALLAAAAAIGAYLAYGGNAPAPAAGAKLTGELLGASAKTAHWAEVRLADGRKHRFKVEIAATPDKRQLGLMHRKSLDRESGMLFIFETERPQSFWMRNTLIPLDILYFDAKGRLVSIQAQAKPLDETPLPSEGPAQFVLEINGGQAAELGIGFGAVLRSSALTAIGLGE